MKEQLFEKYKQFTTMEHIELRLDRARQSVIISQGCQDKDLIYKDADETLRDEFYPEERKLVMPAKTETPAKDRRFKLNRRYF